MAVQSPWQQVDRDSEYSNQPTNQTDNRLTDKPTNQQTNRPTDQNVNELLAVTSESELRDTAPKRAFFQRKKDESPHRLQKGKETTRTPAPIALQMGWLQTRMRADSCSQTLPWTCPHRTTNCPQPRRSGQRGSSQRQTWWCQKGWDWWAGPPQRGLVGLQKERWLQGRRKARMWMPQRLEEEEKEEEEEEEEERRDRGVS